LRNLGRNGGQRPEKTPFLAPQAARSAAKLLAIAGWSRHLCLRQRAEGKFFRAPQAIAQRSGATKKINVRSAKSSARVQQGDASV
jgi:hypothetical protein